GLAGSPPTHAWKPQPPVDAYFFESMNTGDEPGPVGLFRHQHGVREVPRLEVRWDLGPTFRARE
ncbi:MAG: hypothetical protein ACRD3Q_07250, partial [Terriglobales bacterium]